MAGNESDDEESDRCRDDWDGGDAGDRMGADQDRRLLSKPSTVVNRHGLALLVGV